MKMKCLTICLLLCLCVGCKRIELYDYHARVRLDLCVDLSLKTMPDTSILLAADEFIPWWKGQMPYHVDVLIYHPETGEIISSQMLTSEGGVLRLPNGDFDMVVYSLGAEWTQIDDVARRQEAEAFTSDVTLLYADLFKTVVRNDSANGRQPIDDAYEQHPVVYAPDHVYVSVNKQIHIPSLMEHEEYVLTDTIQTIVEVYSLEVLGVQGLENIRKVDAFVTGQVRSCYFAQPELSRQPASLYVPMKIDVEGGRLYTLFGTFGKFPAPKTRCI